MKKAKIVTAVWMGLLCTDASVTVAGAQTVTEEWSQTYTGLERAYAAGVTVHNGSVYSAGTTMVAGGPPDIFFLKYDLAGTPVWERTWGGSDSDSGGKITPYDNYLYVSGTSRSYAYDLAGDLEGDAMTVKWSEDGVCDNTNSTDCWWTRFSGDAGYWGAESASNVAVDASGNLYVVGTSERGWGNPWAYVEQYNSAGVMQWHQHYGTSGAHHYSNYAGLALSGGNVFTTGRIDYGDGDDQLVVRKYTTGGALEWGFTWGDGSTDELGSSIVVSGADVYVAGALGAIADPNGMDLLLVKLHDDGGSASFVGSTTLATTGNDSGMELKLVGGTLYVVGSIDVGGNTDSLLAAYDMDLAPLWDYSWGTAEDDVAFSLAVHEGVIYVAGMENAYTKAYINAYSLVLYVDADAAGPTHDGSNWCDAYLTLQDALSIATPGTTIQVADGTYMPDGGYIPDGGAHVPGTADRAATFQLITGVTIEGGYAGCGAPDPDARDIAANETILSGDLLGNDAPFECVDNSPDCDLYGGLCVDGFCIINDNNAENSYHVTNGSGTDAAATLDGFTVTGGNADGTSPDNKGAGMFNSAGNPTLTSCTFSGNSATSNGGALYNTNDASPTVALCQFKGNAGYLGGGICNFSGSSSVTNSVFSSNTADYGGGMYDNASGSSVIDCSFTGNLATFAGGGMRSSFSSRTAIIRCSFDNNTAAFHGAGISAQDSSVTCTSCVFTRNRANGSGGALICSNSRIAITNSTLSDNTASSGGGMHIFSTSSSVISNSTFSGNSASFDGGGILNFNISDLVVENCIFWGNVDDADGSSGGPFMDESAQIDDDGTGTFDLNYSIIQGWTGSLGGVGNIGADPLFVDADGSDNIPGTVDDDLRLRGGSPAIDEGNNNVVPPDTMDLDGDLNTTEPIPFDLDGNDRFVDDPATVDGGVGTPPIVDMGAYEYQPPIYVDASATGANDGTTWTDAYLHLQDALTEAAGDPRDIWVADGTYMPDGAYIPTGGSYVPGTGDRDATFQLLNGVAAYGGFVGGETSLNDRDITANETILSGDLLGNDAPVACVEDSPDCDSNGGLCVDGFCIIAQNNSENSYHVTTGSGTDATATLNGFTVSAGNANGTNPDNYGGGMYLSGGSPTVANCTFIGNTAEYGGGMFNSLSSSPAVMNCRFATNAADSRGGGMENRNSSPAVKSCTFSQNTAQYAGGMENASGSSPTVTLCTFSGNKASIHGGGMDNISSSSMVTNCSFIGNSASAGGGMRNHWDNCNPAITNCVFIGNTATSSGGGMYNTYSSSPTVTNTTFSGNSASFGGAMKNYISTTSAVTNCTLTGNSAVIGGGMHNDDGGSPTVTNSILWGNSDSGGTDESAQIHTDGGTPVVNYSIVMGGWTGAGGIGNSSSDPLFVDADGLDNIPGTEDDDLRLNGGSPAIDAASTPDVPADTLDLDNDGDTAEPTPFDLDGNIRLVDDWLTPDTGVPGSPVVDMGAYEFYRDCNENGAPDSEDMGLGASGDCNGNNIPDECDIANGTSFDCNFNGVPDDCDILSGFSLDVDPPDGVPDECDPFTGDCLPPDDDAWSCADNWEIPGDKYPDDLDETNGEPGEHVKISAPSDVLLDVDVQVPSVEIGEGATLRVTETGSVGDLDFSSPAVLVIEGTLLVAGDRAIGSGGTESPTVILGESWGPSGIYKADPGAPNTAASARLHKAMAVSSSLAADSITLFDTMLCVTTEQMVLTEQMTVTTTGDFIMDGTNATASCTACPIQTASVLEHFPFLYAGSSAIPSPSHHQNSRRLKPAARNTETGNALGGRTPPILIFRGSASVAVGGDFLMLGSANILNDSTAGISIAGNFDNRSLMPECFDSNAGTFIFDGSGDQKFEVAGRDLGSSLFCDADDSNFTIGTVQIGTDTAGADVRFVNEHFNTVASGSCLEALYVGDLILKAGSHVTFDNCRVYYGNLIAGVGATMSNEGCGEAISLNNPETPILEPSVADIGFGTRMRYLSFSGGTPGTSQAVRVQFDIGNGPKTMWVQEPFRMAEASGDAVAGEPGFWAANLGCIPAFTDWTQWDYVHVLDESIIPTQSYDIALVAEGCESSEAAFSAPLAVDTSKWGDAVTTCVGGVCGSPNGDSNFDDIAAVVDKFRNLPGAPKKSQADVVPSALDFNVDFGDIPAVVDGFRGLPYPYTPPVDPCP